MIFPYFLSRDIQHKGFIYLIFDTEHHGFQLTERERAILDLVRHSFYSEVTVIWCVFFLQNILDKV